MKQRVSNHVLPASRISILLFLVLSLAACDPVRTTRQSVTLVVVDANNGIPIDGAKIRMKNAFDSTLAVTSSNNSDNSELRDHKRRVWEQIPWSMGIADETGNVEIVLTSTTLDRGNADTPPPNRDVITGIQFLVRIEANGKAMEELRVLMQPGKSAKGNQFMVTVKNIQKPQYTYSK